MFLVSNRQNYLISTQKLISDLSPDLESINNSIVPSGDDVGFIEIFESVAKGNGLKIDIDFLVLKDDSSFKNANVTSLEIKAKTSGSWVGTYTFLSELESLPIKVKINNFSMDTAPGSSSDGKKQLPMWQSSFEIVVLKYK